MYSNFGIFVFFFRKLNVQDGEKETENDRPSWQIRVCKGVWFRSPNWPAQSTDGTIRVFSLFSPTSIPVFSYFHLFQSPVCAELKCETHKYISCSRKLKNNRQERQEIVKRIMHAKRNWESQHCQQTTNETKKGKKESIWVALFGVRLWRIDWQCFFYIVCTKNTTTNRPLGPGHCEWTPTQITNTQ